MCIPKQGPLELPALEMSERRHECAFHTQRSRGCESVRDLSVHLQISECTEDHSGVSEDGRSRKSSNGGGVELPEITESLTRGEVAFDMRAVSWCRACRVVTETPCEPVALRYEVCIKSNHSPDCTSTTPYTGGYQGHVRVRSGPGQSERRPQGPTSRCRRRRRRRQQAWRISRLLSA